MSKATKNILITGAAGFIGHHLARHLKSINSLCRIIGVDQSEGSTNYNYAWFDEMKYSEDLRTDTTMVFLEDGHFGGVQLCDFDEIYHLAANMGGMGHITSHALDVALDNILINGNILSSILDTIFRRRKKSPMRLFFSSSACVYPDTKTNVLDEFLDEEDVPGNSGFPDNLYGYEKLFMEQMLLEACKIKEFSQKVIVKIARFENTYGPECEFNGGREKAPAAICRKVITALRSHKGKKTIQIPIWGDGSATRNYTHIDDLCRGIIMLMRSNKYNAEPVNIGSDELISVKDLVYRVGKCNHIPVELRTKTVRGPTGVLGRDLYYDKIQDLGWKPKVKFDKGIKSLYEWVCRNLD